MKRNLIALTLGLLLLGGCAPAPVTPEATPTPDTLVSVTPEATPAPALPLEGHKLMVFCGAGMKLPFSDIAAAFQAETGCEVVLTFANAAQIQTQINTAQEGDLFIAGSAEELKPVKEFVSVSKDLVKHVPVLAVQKGNPKDIRGIADLANQEIRLLLGDAESTPIGKIGDKVLKDFGIFDKVNLVARTTTAPAIVTALVADECDAAIVWKENAGKEAELVDTPDMDKYVKTVPAASLSFSADAQALEEFLAYLDTAAAKDIWVQYGYEVLN
ncbi:MAG: molybdate ABC transporter substrate-binding protein [Oscillospiraceae bacterium]